MKRTQYQCLKCKSIIHFQIRDLGKLPETVGCKTDKCDGISIEMPYIQKSEGDPEAIFFRPQNNDEWKGVGVQLKFEIQQRFPKAKIKDIRKMTHKVMNNFRDHVKGGGLVYLPFSFFTKTSK